MDRGPDARLGLGAGVRRALAWVVFRTGPDYIGWAPVPPGYRVGASVDVAGGEFVFVSSRNFLSTRIRTCVVPERTARVVVNRTRVVNTITVQNNVVVNRGPDVRVIEKASGRTVTAAPIEAVARVGLGRRFSRSEVALTNGTPARDLHATSPYSATRPLPSGREAAREPSASSRSAGPATGHRRSSPEKENGKNLHKQPTVEPEHQAAGSAPAPPRQGTPGNSPKNPYSTRKSAPKPHKQPHEGAPSAQPEGTEAGGGTAHDRKGPGGEHA